MTKIVNDKALVVKKNIKKKRPDGTDIARYKEQLGWSKEKWAWEFLRRNEKFIEACKSFKSSTDEEKQEVLKFFWLEKFKHYSQSYEGGLGKPKFTIAEISTWPNIELDTNESTLIKVKISEGQVLVQFNLDAGLIDKRAIDRQLESAKKILDKKLEILAKKHNKPLIAHRPQSYIFGTYLRILDHLASGKKNLDCAKLIHVEMAAELDANLIPKTDMHDKVGDQVDAAKLMAEKGYLYLLLDKNTKK